MGWRAWLCVVAAARAASDDLVVDLVRTCAATGGGDGAFGPICARARAEAGLPADAPDAAPARPAARAPRRLDDVASSAYAATFDALADACEAGVATVAATAAFYAFAREVVVADAVTLYSGVKSVFDGNGTTRLFLLDGANASLTLSGVTLAGGFSATYGGAVFNDGGALVLSSVDFYGNEATDGGAVASLRGSVTVNGGVFEGNAANGTGGGVAVYFGELAVYYATFRNCSSGGDGGALFARESATSMTVAVVGATFADNFAAGGGAAVAVDSYNTLYVASSTFERNIGHGAAGCLQASNLWAGALTVTGSTFRRNANFADSRGTDSPAVFGLQGGVYSVLSNNVFEHNYGTANVWGCTLVGFCTLDGDVFRNNTGAVRGTLTMVYVYYAATVTGVTFEDNAAAFGGAISIADYMGAAYAVSGSTFARNVAAEDPDAENLRPGTVVDGGSTTGAYYSGGGAIFFGGENIGSLSVASCVFAGNRAAGQPGGAIRSYGAVAVADSTFASNRAADGGALHVSAIHYRFFSSDLGGFYDWAYYGSAAVSDCAFIGNGAEDSGGAIYSLDAEMSFARANFTDNAAGVDGGALYYTVDQGLSSGVVDLDACVLEGNYAGIDGGAVYGLDVTAVVGRGATVFRGNAAHRGAAVWVSSAAATIADVALVGNAADLGAGVFVDAQSGVALANVTSAGNLASVGGGLIYCGDYATCAAADVVSEGDASSQTAGAAYLAVGVVATFRNFACVRAAALRGGCVSGNTVASLAVSASTFEGCVAGLEGGAIYLSATSGLAAISDSVVRGAAAEAAAVYVVMGSIALDGVAFEDNAATTGGGALALGYEATGTLEGCAFVGNENGGSGGAAAVGPYSSLACVACAFTGNAAALNGGAVHVSDATSALSLANSTLSGNAAAYAGGGLYVSGAAASLGGNVFEANAAALSGGGAVYLAGANASFAVAASDAFRGNAAARGGGGVFMFDAQTTAAPVVPAGATLANNSALYGNTTASTVFAIALAHDAAVAEASNVPLAAPLVVTALDALGQVVATVDADSWDDLLSERVVLSSRWTNASLTGTLKLEFAGGVAATDDLTVTCAPDAAVPMVASWNSADVDFEASAVLPLRACEPGEAVVNGGAACATCPAGSYGFDPAEACAGCPDYATCAGGLSVVLDRGYWRSAYDSVNIRKCPFEAYCNDADVELWNGSAVDPAAQCDRDHAGPLCALCRRGYKLDSGDGECVKCSGGGGSSYERIYGILVGLALCALLVALCKRFAAPCFEAGAEVAVQLSYYFDEIRAIFKILLVFYQIVGNVPRCFPRLELPRIFSGFTARLQFLDFDLAAWAGATCVGSYDFLDKLLGLTVAPLVVGVALFLGYALSALRDPEKRGKRKEQISMVALIVSFLVFTTCSSVVIRALQCDGDFDDRSEKAHSPYFGDAYLYVDYSVSCDGGRYRAYRAYALLMVFVYPLGIPAVYVVLLLCEKQNIAPADETALARRVLDESDGVDDALAAEELRFVAAVDAVREHRRNHEEMVKRKLDKHTQFAAAKGGGAFESLKHAQKAVGGADHAVHVLASRRAKRLLKVKLIRARNLVMRRDCALEYLRLRTHAIGGNKAGAGPGPAKRRASRFESGATAAAEFALGANLVTRHREVCPECKHLAFLFQEYDPACWYFEVLECARRLALTCVLPLPQSLVDPESLSHTAFATMVALVFALLYAHLKPFASDELDTFANIMQAVLFLNLFVVLVMNSDNSAEQAKMRTGISHAILGALLIVANTLGASAAACAALARSDADEAASHVSLLERGRSFFGKGGDEAKGGDAGDEATRGDAAPPAPVEADAPRPRKPPTAVNEASAHGRAAAVAAHVSLFRDGDAPGTSATPGLFVDPPPPDIDDVVIAPRPSFSEAQVDLHYDDSSAPPLSGDEIVQLVVLGYTRADAETVAPTEGRRFIHAAQGWDDHFEESP